MFYNFWKLYKIANTPCVYCNNLLDNNSLFGSGLDRIDNLKGYENENVVSCCKTCNMIKGEVFYNGRNKNYGKCSVAFKKKC